MSRLNFVTYCLVGEEKELEDFRRNLLMCEEMQTEGDVCEPKNLSFLNSPQIDAFWWKESFLYNSEKGDKYSLKTTPQGQLYIEWLLVFNPYKTDNYRFRELIENHYHTIHIYYIDSLEETNDEEGVFFRRLVNINEKYYELSAGIESEKYAILHLDENIQGETLIVEPYVEYSGEKYPVTIVANVYVGSEWKEPIFPKQLKEIILPKGVLVDDSVFYALETLKITEV